jgi:transposase-like protein
MPITATNPFKGQYPGEVILLAVRWYLRYPHPQLEFRRF